MPAMIETLFVTREPAWHGLGTVLPESPTSEDALVAAGLDWTVSSNPVFDSAGNEIFGYKANVRSSDQSVLGIVSDRYTIIQNVEAFKFVDELTGEGLTYESAGSLRGGKQTWLLGHMPKQKILDDDFDPYICFTNTFDGTGAVRVVCTPTRVVCQNTLNLALSTAKRAWSTRHMGNLESRLIEAQTTLGLIEAYNSELAIEAERLAAVKISSAEVEAMIDALYPIKEDARESSKAKIIQLKEDFFARIAAPDLKGYAGSAYAVVNAAADFADHATPMRLTKNFEENRWGQVIAGHPFVDNIYKMVQKVAA